MEQINDLFNAFIPIWFEKDEAAKKEKMDKYFAENVPALFTKFNMRLGMEGREFFIGDSLTAVDLLVMAICDTFKGMVPEETFVANLQNLAKHLAKVRALPAVVAHNKKCNEKK